MIFSVTLSDFETGLVHTVDGVSVARSSEGDDLTISSAQLKFETQESFHGRKADRLLVRLLGADFANQNLSVYRGRIVFRYVASFTSK